MKKQISIEKEQQIRILTVVGARPQFIKAAMVSRMIDRNNHNNDNGFFIDEDLIHTGQHYDHNMNQVFFDQLPLPKPKYHLEVGSGTHGKMTGTILQKIETVLLRENPDVVLVYGDTNSTIAGALAATKLHIPVAHIEAGLRSFNMGMPEEINRIVTDRISNILFCPTNTAVNNLKDEGIEKCVFKVGDVMNDAFLVFQGLAKKKSAILADLELIPKRYCLATVHRQENTDDPEKLKSIFCAFNELASPDCPIIIPIHPRTRKALQNEAPKLTTGPYVRLIPPVNYLDMINLETNAQVILTDSGGMQKEAYFAKIPCITLRDETEWVETIETGWNRLSGSNKEKIIDVFDDSKSCFPSEQPDLYGRGQASRLILTHLISDLANSLG